MIQFIWRPHSIWILDQWLNSLWSECHSRSKDCQRGWNRDCKTSCDYKPRVTIAFKISWHGLYFVLLWFFLCDVSWPIPWLHDHANNALLMSRSECMWYVCKPSALALKMIISFWASSGCSQPLVSASSSGGLCGREFQICIQLFGHALNLMQSKLLQPCASETDFSLANYWQPHLSQGSCAFATKSLYVGHLSIKLSTHVCRDW